MKITLKEKSKTLFFVYFDDVAWGILPRKKLQAFLHLDLHNIEFNENQINELIKKIKSYAWNKLLDYLSYKEATSGVEVAQEKIDELASEVNKNWWKANRSKFIK